MEAICPTGECVVSEATYTILTQNQGLEEMGEYRFKGIDRPVQVYKTKTP
jgi:adenylate cyclase